MSTRRGLTRKDCVSWALPDNSRSYHELLPLLHLKKVVCRRPYLLAPLTPRCTTLAVAQGKPSQIPGQRDAVRSTRTRTRPAYRPWALFFLPRLDLATITSPLSTSSLTLSAPHWR